MGKNFSCNNLGQRRKSDFYETPYSLTRHLLNVEPMWNQVLEPAAGKGAIVRVLQSAKYNVTAYDVERDFLKETRKFPVIVTNPPFSLAHEFIQHAMTVAELKFCFLLPLSHLHGKQRFDSLAYRNPNFPLARVHIFTRYPMLGDPLRDDGKYRTGMMVYAWFVWDRSHAGAPTLHWIDNHADVLSAAEAQEP